MFVPGYALVAAVFPKRNALAGLERFVLSFTASLAAIPLFGRYRTIPGGASVWVIDGQVTPRRVITATLSGDHRATDGHRGALFLDAVARLLQAPEKL